MLNQYISYLDILKYAGDQRNQVEDLLDQIDKELKDPVVLTRSIMDELINMYLILDESQVRNIVIDEDEIETAIKIYFGYESGTTDVSSDKTETNDKDSVGQTPTTQSPVATPYTREAYEENYRTYFEGLYVDTGMSENTLRSLFESKLRTEKLRSAIGEEQEFLEEEQVHVKHILFSLDNLDAAASVLTRALEGENFDKLALEFSDDVSNAAAGGDLGWVARGEMVNSFEEVIFSADVGGLTDLVATQFGLHVVEILGKEMRVLPETILAQRRNQALDKWLFERRNDAGIEILNWWEALAPAEPTLQDFYVLAEAVSQLDDGGLQEGSPIAQVRAQAHVGGVSHTGA